MKIKTIAAMAVLVALGAGQTLAQIVPFTDDFALTSGDIEAMDAALDTLVNDPGAGNGSKADWTNQRTGSSGTVMLVDTVKLGNFEDCKRIQYDINTARVRDMKRFVLDLCEVEEGVWKTYP